MPFDIDASVATTPGATDPDFTAAMTKTRPEISPPTTDPSQYPDRYTIWVPSEATTFSLGHKGKKKDDHPEEPKHYIEDLGITGRTDNHVHLHVVKDPHATVMSMGGPATSVKMKEPHDPKVPTESEGYSMITDKNAWHESHLQHYLVSRTKDIVVRALGPATDATALLQSDLGVVTIAAGQAITLGGKGNVKIMSQTGAPIEAEPKYEAKVERKVTEEFNTKYTEAATATTDHLTAVYDKLVEAVKTTKKKPKLKENAWEDGQDAGEVQALLDKVKALCDKLKELLKPETTGSVDLIAEKHISVASDQVTLFGTSNASLASAGTAEVSGDFVAIGAKTTAALWSGTHSSVKSGTDVSIEAETGELTAQASKDVLIASETKGVAVQGETDAQLNGKTGKVFVHGATDAYLGAGGGSGYGVCAKADKIQLAKLGTANKFGGPGPDADVGITLDSSAMKVSFAASSKMEIKSAEVKFTTTDIKLDASGTVTVNGASIKLG